MTLTGNCEVYSRTATKGPINPITNIDFVYIYFGFDTSRAHYLRLCVNYIAIYKIVFIL
jgi:hypothetical protein